MPKIDTICPECEEEIVVDKFVKYTMRELDGAYTFYKITCPACGVRTQTEDSPIHGFTVVNPSLPKANQRDPNSGARIVGSTRWSDIPADLKEKLEEEARLRKAREEGEDV